MSQEETKPSTIPLQERAADIETFCYDDTTVRKFVVATMLWGIVAFLLGVVIASQMADWRLNLDIPWLTFGRLRPLHTNAAIFAFAGNAIFAAIYYSSQRLLKTRMYSDFLSTVHFWGWQLIIVAAAITLPLGYTVSKEYAELEWPISIAIAVIWVVFAVNLFGTIARRREQHIYVAIWFYIATVITVGLLHIVNSLAIPVSMMQSYPMFGGAADALVQWWYGHNAVAFVLTTPFLGLMYYFLPKAANRPIYSYRLSIIHFWALIFLYIWAGPHHLLYTALPEWAQTLGMVFSVMLWAPSWAGMMNGLLTLRGSFQQIRRDPVLKFFVAGLTFYGMATFEGPLLSIKAVNSLAHYTDWIVAHVHGGALGWNGFMTFGMIYFLVPKLWKSDGYSVKLANLHFWLATLGIVLYMLSMWVSGITQGLMWRAVDGEGRLLYPDFMETVLAIVPLYYVRAVGGLMFLAGALIMVYNMAMTIKTSRLDGTEETASAMPLRPVPRMSLGKTRHRRLEGLPLTFSILTAIAVLVGSIVTIAPLVLSPKAFHGVNTETSAVIPYTALEQEGRDIYVKEGCYNCHSQMIRPLEAEYLRYGPRSLAEESMYDRPFQWGSKRTGPDLARIGGKYPDLWHYRHMEDPRQTSPRSIMPSYPWLITQEMDLSRASRKLSVMRTLGVPYTDEQIENAKEDAKAQALAIATALAEQGAPEGLENKKIVALIAYMQKLGTDHDRIVNSVDEEE